MNENEDFGLPPEVPAKDAAPAADPQAEIEALKRQLADAQRINALQAELAALKAQSGGLFKAPADADVAPPGEGVGPVDAQGFPKEYVWITVYRSQNPQDRDYVTPAIGGYALKVTRGEKVVIPKCFAEVLDHCIEDITISGENGLITRPSHRFPFTIHGPATEDEYLTFKERMRDMGRPRATQ